MMEAMDGTSTTTPAPLVTREALGAFTQRNASEPSGRSTYTPSRNSMRKCG